MIVGAERDLEESLRLESRESLSCLLSRAMRCSQFRHGERASCRVTRLCYRRGLQRRSGSRPNQIRSSEQFAV